MARMGGVHTVRGIGYQHAQAILAVLDAFGDPEFAAVRIEGVDDVVDVEVLDRSDTILLGLQIKTRETRTWGKVELLGVLHRWAKLRTAANARFEFVTDGRLGPTGRKVAAALEAAHAGDTAILAGLLGEPASSAVCTKLSHARIREDEPSGIETLLTRAERQVLTMLPNSRSALDATEQAEQAIDRLLRTTFIRTADNNPGIRKLTRTELAELLGVPADGPSSVRWHGELRTRYLVAAQKAEPADAVDAQMTRESFGPGSVSHTEASAQGTLVSVAALLDGSRSAVLSGPSGTGKSTAATILRREAARSGRVVLLAHAEAYISGRIAALAADALADVLKREVPTSAGRQALADAGVVMLIDGASEIPENVRKELLEDVRAPLAAGQGARIVLLGRDVAAMSAMLPTSRPPDIYTLAPFRSDRQLELAARIINDGPSHEPAAAGGPAALRMHLAQAEDILGSAIDNPMFLAMALESQLAGTTVETKSGLFQAAVERLCRRGGVTGVTELSAGLGIIYCVLLDLERRYADRLEWSAQLQRATVKLSEFGISITPAQLDEDARRCGLISPLGWSQTLVPVHDAFADYLAGLAHGRGLVPLPSLLRSSDQQRVLFAAEVGGVNRGLALAVARDLPFSTVELAQYDNRALTTDSIDEIEQILALLTGDTGGRVSLSNCGGGTVIAMRGSDLQPGWVENGAARQAMRNAPAAVVEHASPVRVAVRLWRLGLVILFGVPERREDKTPQNAQEARDALADYAGRTVPEIEALVSRVAPPGHGDLVMANMPPTGLRASVGSREEFLGSVEWPVTYQFSDSIDTGLPDEPNPGLGGWRSTTFSELTRRGPRAEAVSRVKRALETLTIQNWLSP